MALSHVDLQPGDFPGDFTRTGFRVPLIVIPLFAKAGRGSRSHGGGLHSHAEVHRDTLGIAGA